MQCRLSLIATLLIAPAGMAQAQVFREVAPNRSIAMGGAHRGLGTSNDALFLNPAGMVAEKRYSLDGHYAFTNPNRLSHIGVSAVDSTTSRIAGGLAFVHTRGDEDGVDASLNRILLGAAYPVVPNLSLGLTVRHIRGDFREPVTGKRNDVALYSGDVGVLLRLGPWGAGFVYQNVVETDEPRFTPQLVTGGLSYTAELLTLAADVVVDTETEDNEVRYLVGAEYFIDGVAPLRFGYQRRPYLARDGSEKTEDLLSGGLGYITDSGALEAAFSRSLKRARQWTLSLSIRVFL